jgi:protoporphyrinogen/coproporphyrinogen III oxidase
MPVTVAVVGGGITGLVTAHTLQTQGVDVIVFEAADRLGGKILTTEVAGVRVDAGPDAFLVREKHMTDLAAELHLDNALVAPVAGQASLWLDGALRPLPRRQYLGVPLDLDELAEAGLVSATGLARARQDLDGTAQPASDDDDVDHGPDDETVGELVRRHLGDEIMDALVAPLIGGINAGDPDQLSLAAGLPQLAAAAGHDPSLIRSIRRHLADQARPADAPVFLTHPDGLGRVIDTLALRLGPAARTHTPVRSLTRADTGWLVHADGHPPFDVEAVVVATPAFAAADLVRPVSADAATLLDGIRYASVVMVTFAFPARAMPAFAGSGFLVPREAGLTMTACSWASSKWAHLAGQDLVFLRVSAGHADDESAMELDDEQLVATLLAELASTAGVDADPVETRITRWPSSFPQYRPGHLDRVEAIDETLADEAPGLFVAGAAYRGLGLPACAQQARVAALRVRSHLERSDTASDQPDQPTGIHRTRPGMASTRRRVDDEPPWHPETRNPMHIEVTDEAAKLLRKRGGTMTVDYIRPTG